MQGTSRQQWRLVQVAGGYYTIVNRNSGKVLDVANRSSAGGAGVLQWTDRGSTNQQWVLQLP
ncbi:RICIN domain-containing protein [Streptomyces sp. NPDC000618]|uniref:RICIN domain-containing protein n=1 Tax=Streptomyces sp. NPDC000618 TaxID=3154265 RepID=UPI003317C6B9